MIDYKKMREKFDILNDIARNKRKKGYYAHEVGIHMLSSYWFKHYYDMIINTLDCNERVLDFIKYYNDVITNGHFIKNKFNDDEVSWISPTELKILIIENREKNLRDLGI